MKTMFVPPPINASAVYLVLDDLGKWGHVWREADEIEATEQKIVEDIITGQYTCPLRVVAFNTEEDWARDVTSVPTFKPTPTACRCPGRR